MKLIDQKRTGLFPEHPGVSPAANNRVRLTIPAREALEAAGSIIVQTASEPRLYTVTLGKTVPAGIVAVRLANTDHLGLRLGIEPEYPGEIPDRWAQLDFLPCPKCGAPLIWYEAGYVPGYRVCAKKPHHHMLAR